MRALIDTNILLDLFLEHRPFVDQAEEIWEAARQGRFEAFISAMTPVNVFYVTRKIKGETTARYVLTGLLSTFSICPIDQKILEQALTFPQRDYEDAVQIACALASGLEAIATRDLTGFSSAPLPAFSPEEFLSKL